MSPRNNDVDRARRKRLRIAIVTSNAAGTAVGIATQALASDPTVAAFAATFVAGVTADLLLQKAVARDEDAVADPELDGLEDETGFLDELPEDELPEDELPEDELPEDDVDHDVVDEQHEVPAGEDDDSTGHRHCRAHHGHGRHRRPTGHGYARCAGHHHPQQRIVPYPQREMTIQQHPRHGHLYRAGQRFVHRYRQRNNEQQS